MENANYMNNQGAGLNASAPSSVLPSYEGYMNAQGVAEQTAQPVVSENIPPVETAEPERVKPYTFRRLNSTDLFPLIKIISKIGLDELTQVFEGDALKSLIAQAKQIKDSNNTEQTEQRKKLNLDIIGIGVALKLVNKILEHIPLCEQEVYTLLSRVSGMNVEEVKNLDIDVFMEMILDFIMKEEFKDFFRAASGYINRLG